MTLNTLRTRTNIRNVDYGIIDNKMASSMVMDSDHPIMVTWRNDGTGWKSNQVAELKWHDDQMAEDEGLKMVDGDGDIGELRVLGDEEGDFF